MGIDVEFWYDIAGTRQLFGVQVHALGELWEPFREIFRPLTCDVIGEHELSNNGADEAGKDNEIHVCVSVSKVSVCECGNGNRLASPPFVNYPCRSCAQGSGARTEPPQLQLTCILGRNECSHGRPHEGQTRRDSAVNA